MSVFERIVIEAEPGYKKKLREIAVLTDRTMKDVILEFIDQKHSEVIKEINLE